jgi:phospholipase C
MEKIEHLVILMMENRSFDHFLGSLASDPVYPFKNQVDGLKAGLSNLDLNGNVVQPWAMDGEPFGYPDLPHGPGPQMANYNGGQMDGFVKNYEQDLLNAGATPADAAVTARIAMGYYTRETLPVLYALADNFSVADAWHSSMLSSTWPNRKYLHSGRRDSDPDTQSLPAFPGFETTPLWNVLEDVVDKNGNRLTWKSYFTDLPFLAFWYKFAALHIRNFTSIVNFVADCREDSLPTVSVIDPAFSLADDHPTHDVVLGQKFMGLVVDALTHSEAWDKTALIITYDENGGFYDHVVPPVPFDSGAVDTPLGFRVPTIVMSPYTPAGVCHQVFDHTSILKSIAVRWGIDFPTDTFGTRFVNAPDIWSSSMFDFSMNPTRPQGVYTELAGQPAPLKDVAWETGIHDLMINPIGDLEALLERMFLLPSLKTLDNRAGVFNALNSFETNVVNLKRMV